MFGNPETTPGGRALKFYASVRLDVRRIESIKQGTDVVGSRAKVRVVKNKVAPPFSVAEFDIMYNEGISKEGGLLDLAVELGLVRKTGAFFSYGETRLGQGRENAQGVPEARTPRWPQEIERLIRQQTLAAKTPVLAAVGAENGQGSRRRARGRLLDESGSLSQAVGRGDVHACRLLPDRATQRWTASLRRSSRRSAEAAVARNVFVDGRYAFSLSTELAVRAPRRRRDRLGARRPICSSRTSSPGARRGAALPGRPAAQRARDPRSARARTSSTPQIVDRVIERLRELGLVDDAAFAEYWVEQRQTHRPRGGRLLKRSCARRASTPTSRGRRCCRRRRRPTAPTGRRTRKASACALLDERTFRQRLGAFLQRRGFDYETVTAVTRLWNELRATSRVIAA